MICTKCNIDKMETEFYNRYKQCKVCTNKAKLAYNKQYRVDNKKQRFEYNKQYRLDNKAAQEAYHKKYRIEHRVQKNQREKQRKKDDINYKLGINLRSRLRHAIKNNQKVGSAVSDLGCSISNLKHHIESQFSEGMTWNNYGEWQLDHKIPLSKFNLEDRSLFLIANNYTNLQPLWSKDNLSKHDRSIFDYTEGVF